MVTAVISKDGTRLMPTTNIKKVRRLLNTGRAHIEKHNPFTIRLHYDPEEKGVQPIELCEDTGYLYIGVSVKSEKHEFVSEERNLLPDEKKHHQKQKRYRNSRRNRIRYRKPLNKRALHSRKKEKGRIPPSLQHKAEAHVAIIKKYAEVFPITGITLEMGQFDTQVLAAVNQGLPIPEGIDYQHGPKYGYDTLREAVFSRDKYTCQCCKKSAIKDGRILVIHHIGFRKGGRSNRMGNLLTVCTRCHISKNHKEGGALWDIKPKTDNLAPATYMNTVKWAVYREAQKVVPEVHITYGAATKRERLTRNMVKSHANDAYRIGSFRPRHRAQTRYYKKRRRNNRCLEKFYDAKYIDYRTGKEKKAAELGCNRTKRNVSRRNPNNERVFRGKKLSSGRRSIRRKRYPAPSGSIVMYRGNKYRSGGNMHYGEQTKLIGLSDVPTSEVKVLSLPGGWISVGENEFYKKKGV